MNISVGKTQTDVVEPFRNAVERSIREGGEVVFRSLPTPTANLSWISGPASLTPQRDER
jgi:hypothetical protein